MLDEIEPLLRELCAVAARETMPRFRMRLDVDNKEDGSNGFDPVTEADREAERAIRRYLAEHCPDHGILGEEEAPLNPDAEYCWHIDPVDGTRAFICGLPSWGTLIGLAREGKAIAGVMHQPFTGEMFLADGETTWAIRGDERKALSTSGITELGDAKLMTTTPFLFADDIIDGYRNLEARVRLARYGFDCYAYAMVAAGHIDLVVESSLKSYDIAALIPVIEQAGGVVTTWTGENAISGGSIVAAATPSLHQAALELLDRN
ncbi:MAG: histidinol-phosphatase [Nitratireductor sp.]|nr:histidinol-phosphatase [Nitratireductor sp.]